MPRYADLEREYRNMYETYSRIFTRLGLKFRAVAADTGAIGGTGSHEFHVLADSGEDAIAFCPDSDYAANVELAEAVAPQKVMRSGIPGDGAGGTATMEKKATPNKTKCEDVAAFLGLPLTQTVKAIAVMAEKEGGSEFVLLLLRGDHDLNEIKAQKVVGTFRFARDEEIVEALGCKAGYIGAVGFAGRVVVRPQRRRDGRHGLRRQRGRLPPHRRQFRPRPAATGHRRRHPQRGRGRPSPDGKGVLDLCRGIEVGHIFQLRTKYAEALKCTFLDEQGKDQVMEMGCYGIGVTRIVGAAIEQGHDASGIIFPAASRPSRWSSCR
jgi:prolyl-tRNA synthetase